MDCFPTSRLSAPNSDRQPSVATAVDEERLTLLLRESENVTDEDAMIATVIGRVQAAIAPRDRAPEDGSAGGGGHVGHAAEGRVDERRTVREPVREEFVVLPEDADGKGVRL